MKAKAGYTRGQGSFILGGGGGWEVLDQNIDNLGVEWCAACLGIDCEAGEEDGLLVPPVQVAPHRLAGVAHHQQH